jgi:hypothetical protein
MARFCVVTETYHVSAARNPSFMQQRRYETYYLNYDRARYLN